MTELETKLSQILEEKQNKIIPENIKKGIQIFDIEGTYEGNSGDVKLFETKKQMQQDPNANEGDLAVVYREEIQNMTADSQTQFITFPETVTLPSAITESYYCMLRAVDPSKMFDGNIQLSKTSFRFDGYSESGMIMVQYSSSDGITYTRTRFSGDSGDLTNPVDLGTEIHCEMQEQWNDNFGYFMQIGGNTFEGLFEYSFYKDKTKIKLPLMSGLNIQYDSSSNIISSVTFNKEFSDEINFTKLVSVYNKFISDTSTPNNAYIYLDNNNNLKFVQMSYMLCYDKNVSFLGASVTISTDTDTTAKVYNINLENETYTLETNLEPSGHIYGNSNYNWNYYNLNNKTIPFNIVNSKPTNFNRICVGDTTSSKTSYTQYIEENDCYVDASSYILAPTQLTTTKDLVYNSIYYGKDGVNEGTLTQNVSNSFADINAEVYSKIQQVYNNMEPRVLTDGDKEIDQNIHFIPTKLDGTPLLDTSNVTDMYVMFFKCENLTSIPQLDTSNVTNMNGTFENCTNLKTIANLNTSKVENMNSIFDGCENLISVPQFDTSSVIYMGAMFSRCQSLVEVPQFDTSKVTKMGSMFIGCTNLVTVPQFDMSSIVYSNLFNHDIQNMFSRCPSLSSDSLNNILKSLLTATSYTETKTLAYIGLSEEQATTCTTLSNWSALEAKGWTTGY